MTIKQTKIGWSFWLKWVLVTTIGFIIFTIVLFFFGKAVAFIINYPHEEHFFYWLAYKIYFISICAGVAIIQWFILRKVISRVGWWAPAIAAGFVLVSIVLYALPITRKHILDTGYAFADNLSWIMFLALGGILAGVFQWFFLRRQISRAGWWVLANAVGWSLGAVGWWLSDLFLFKWIYPISPASGFLDFLLIFAHGLSVLLFGIIMSAVTGGALVWLLRQLVNVKSITPT